MANRLTRAQQHALAGAVIAEVGQLIEFWDERSKTATAI